MPIMFKQLRPETVEAVAQALDKLPIDVVVTNKDGNTHVEMGNEYGDVTFIYCDMARAFVLEELSLRPNQYSELNEAVCGKFWKWVSVNKLLVSCEGVQNLVRQAVNVNNVINDVLNEAENDNEEI